METLQVLCRVAARLYLMAIAFALVAAVAAALPLAALAWTLAGRLGLDLSLVACWLVATALAWASVLLLAAGGGHDDDGPDDSATAPTPDPSTAAPRTVRGAPTSLPIHAN